jgi:hypothetical protein
LSITLPSFRFVNHQPFIIEQGPAVNDQESFRRNAAQVFASRAMARRARRMQLANGERANLLHFAGKEAKLGPLSS